MVIAGFTLAVGSFSLLAIGGSMVRMGRHIGPIFGLRLPKEREAEAKEAIAKMHERQEVIWRRAWIPLVLLLVLGAVLLGVGAQ